jgi:hypothetical protein
MPGEPILIFAERRLTALSSNMVETTVTTEGIAHWQSLRGRLRRQWWIYFVVAVIGTFWFVRDFPPRDALGFAVLLLIPIISLRQAWKVARQIAACDARLADINLLNGESHE